MLAEHGLKLHLPNFPVLFFPGLFFIFFPIFAHLWWLGLGFPVDGVKGLWGFSGLGLFAESGRITLGKSLNFP